MVKEPEPLVVSAFGHAETSSSINIALSLLSFLNMLAVDRKVPMWNLWACQLSIVGPNLPLNLISVSHQKFVLDPFFEVIIGFVTYINLLI